MVNAREKGKRGENAFINKVLSMLGRDRTVKDRRNWQWTAFGGANNPDCEIPEFHNCFFEVKNTQNFSFQAWTRKLQEDCPASKVPVLAYREQGKADRFWLTLPMEKLEDFAVTACQAFGWEVRRGG